MIVVATDVARFKRKLSPPDEKGCTVWAAGRGRFGYGKFTLGKPHKRTVIAHRYAWVIAHGTIPPGLFVCHTCDNPPCCNPAHLFLGTAADNKADSVRKGRVARGERSGSRLHPERLARGDQNGSRLYPERLTRGEQVNTAKITADIVKQIRQLYESNALTQVELAAKYNLTQGTVSKIVLRKTWKHV